MNPITDFNPSARNDARRDPRYAVALEQVQPAGNPMVPGGWADTLATDVMAAIRKAEGRHRRITHHTYEGPGPCRAQFYGAGACEYPQDEHELVEEQPAEQAPTADGPSTSTPSRHSFG